MSLWDRSLLVTILVLVQRTVRLNLAYLTTLSKCHYIVIINLRFNILHYHSTYIIKKYFNKRCMCDCTLFICNWNNNFLLSNKNPWDFTLYSPGNIAEMGFPFSFLAGKKETGTENLFLPKTGRKRFFAKHARMFSKIERTIGKVCLGCA